MDVKFTIDTTIDGSSTARTEIVKGKVKGKGVFQQGSRKIALQTDEEFSGRRVRSQQRKAEALDVPVVRLVGPGGDWTEFTLKEGRFSATFPGKPAVRAKKNKTNKTTTCEVIRDRGNISYSVWFTDYTDADPKADPKPVLAALVKQFAKVTKKKKDIKLNGFDGVELLQVQGEGAAKIQIVYRAFLVKGRLYQVMVARGQAAKEKEQSARFLDSFKLQDKKEADL
jgi:hypothetical protein